MIRPCKTSDATDIADIYNHYIQHTTVTFDEKPITTEEIAHRIKNTMMKYPWLVYVRKGKVLGYAYASGWREKSAYRYSAESTIYFNDKDRGKGCGTALYQELLEKLEQKSIHCVFGVIALPNDVSVEFHEKFGFKKAEPWQPSYKTKFPSLWPNQWTEFLVGSRAGTWF